MQIPRVRSHFLLWAFLLGAASLGCPFLDLGGGDWIPGWLVLVLAAYFHPAFTNITLLLPAALLFVTLIALAISQPWAAAQRFLSIIPALGLLFVWAVPFSVEITQAIAGNITISIQAAPNNLHISLAFGYWFFAAAHTFAALAWLEQAFRPQPSTAPGGFPVIAPTPGK